MFGFNHIWMKNVHIRRHMSNVDLHVFMRNYLYSTCGNNPDEKKHM